MDYKVGKFSFMANSRARTVDTADGMVKFLTDAKTDKARVQHAQPSTSSGRCCRPELVPAFGKQACMDLLVAGAVRATR